MRSPRVAVIGAGVSGLCAAIKLREAGIEDVTVYEKGHTVGGTWRDNTYPGLHCDVPSRYFQFSFAPNPGWTRQYSPGPEIGRYLEHVADRFGVRERIRFGVELETGRWEDGRWVLEGGGVRAEADVVITGCGFLHRRSVPDIPGLGTFAGPAFHSSQWDHAVDPASARIGVIGTGSTGVQIVAALGGRARRLVQFTRSPQWVFPMPNRRYGRLTRELYRRVPALNRLAWRAYRWSYEAFLFRAMVAPGWRRRAVAAICRAHLRTVRDPTLRAALTPDHEPGCKRLIASTGYYRALERERTKLVTAPIAEVVPEGVRTADGVLHELDALVLATGFDTHALVRPMEFTGPGGASLSEAWRDGPRGYDTVAVPGLPNLFMVMGPNSPVNVSSMIDVAETQVGYAVEMVKRWRDGEVDAVAPRQDAADRFSGEVQAAMPGTIWASGCSSWYLAEDGTAEIWPWLPARHRELLAEPVLADYEEVGA